jgi:hypothetical protein
MFEDMRHSRVVWRVRFEADRENVVLVLAGNMQIVGASLVVLQVQGCQLEFGDMLRTEESEAMNLLSWLWVLGKLCHSFPDNSLGCVAQHRVVLTIGVDRWRKVGTKTRKVQVRCSYLAKAIKLPLYRPA